jgi:organic radical activating enzyme
MTDYQVSEISGPTVQGEGLHAGWPCAILRFQGCNLWPDPKKVSHVCPHCDTKQLHSGRKMDGHAIVEAVSRITNRKLGLIITGGEPLLQLDNDLLMNICARVQPSWIDIETNGTVEPMFGPMPVPTFMSVSPKNVDTVLAPKVNASWWKILVPQNIGLLNLLLEQMTAEKLVKGLIYLQPLQPQSGTFKKWEYKQNIAHAIALGQQHGLPVSLQLHKMLRLP